MIAMMIAMIIPIISMVCKSFLDLFQPVALCFPVLLLVLLLHGAYELSILGVVFGCVVRLNWCFAGCCGGSFGCV